METFWEQHKSLLEKEECQKAEHYHFYEDKMRCLAGKDYCENVIERIFRCGQDCFEQKENTGNCIGKHRLGIGRLHLTFLIQGNGYW